MAHFHFIGLEGLPEPIKRMLMERGDDDSRTRQIRHDLVKREQASFWNSLAKDQLHMVIRLLSMIAGDEEPGTIASRELGRAEAYMETRFKSCGCGTVHRDPDDFMKDLVERAEEVNAEQQELKSLSLARIDPGPFVNPDTVGKFYCTNCNAIFDTVDERKKESIGTSHNGCVDSSNDD